MNIGRRFFRNPLSTSLWLLICVAMSGLLTMGAGLLYSSMSMMAAVEDMHTTIAVVKDRPAEEGEDGPFTTWSYPDNKLYPGDFELLQQLDMVKAVDLRSVTMGYSPELDPAVLLKMDIGGNQDAYSQCNRSYEEAMVVVTVDRVSFGNKEQYPRLADDGNTYTVTSCQISLECSLEEVYLLHEDYRPCLSEEKTLIVDFTLQEENLIDFEETQNLTGKRLICYGQFDPGEYGYPHTRIMTNHLNAAGIEAFVENGRCTVWNGVGYTDIHGNNQEKGRDVPVFAPIEGTVEDFLKAPENRLWQEQAELWNIRQHSIVVLGTDDFESNYQVVAREMSIVEGRTITDEEYAAGSKVCLISQILAQRSGLTAGDTIHLSQFPFHEYSLEPDIDGMLRSPVQDPYGIYGDLEFLRADETFTVVGIFAQEDILSNGSYSISCNTVFIPNLAMPAGAAGGTVPQEQEVTLYTDELGNKYTTTRLDNQLTYGIYSSVVLENGRGQEFLDALADTELADRFLVFDTGYAGIRDTMAGLPDSARTILLLCAAGWVLLLGLYLLLYQGAERQNLGIMRSLGTTVWQTRRYLFGSGTLLATLGIVLGGIAGGLFSGNIRLKLVEMAVQFDSSVTHSGAQALDSALLEQLLADGQMPASLLCALILGQLLLTAVACWLHSACLAGRNPRQLPRMQGGRG